MKRIVILFVLALVVAGSLVYAQAYDPKKTYEVTMGVYGDLEKAYTQVFATDDFKSKYPNITVKFQTADINSHHNRVLTVMAAGEATNDIEALEAGYIAQLVSSGGLADLGAPPFNGKKFIKDIVKFAVSNATNGNGNLVAIPVDIAPAIMLYRADLAKAAGVNMDNLADWDAFIAASKKLTDASKGQFSLTHANDVAMIPLNGGKGGWFSKDGKPLEPKQRFIDDLNLVQKVRAAKIDGDLGAWSGPWSQAYMDGKIATAVNGAWFGGTLRTWLSPEPANTGKWRVAYLPGKMYASLGGTYLSIPETVPAPRKMAAWEVIKYLTMSANAQLTTFKAIDAFPALTTVYNDPVMSEPVAYYGGQPVRKIFADVALHIPEMVVSEYDAVILGIWNSALNDVVTGKATPQQAYDAALKKVVATIQ